MTNSSADAYLGARIAPDPGLAHLQLVGAGKVRDVYALDDELLLFVTSDRVSAFDVIFAEGVPHKGRVLTAVAAHWFERTGHLIPNHLVTTDVDAVPGLAPHVRERLAGRVMVVQRARPTPVEWVVRGYLAGSGWKEYRASGGLWGQALPAGLRLADRLPEPLLTPTTKDDDHDRPLRLEEARTRVGAEVFDGTRAASFALFDEGTRVLGELGILLADTKFEFGVRNGELLLIDEALTPDSSRMWPSSAWTPGENQQSYDKQILRDWLESTPWNKEPPPPAIDPDVLVRLARRYLDLCERLTGRRIADV